MSVLFVPLPIEWYEKAPYLFDEKRSLRSKTKKRSHNEVSELLWIDEDEMLSLVSPQNRKMWGRVRKFYQHGYDENLRKALKMVYTC